ncbi:MAG: MBL fold metallo-hydrolase, partial [Nitrosomonas halophila]
MEQLPSITDYPAGISVIDAQYHRPGRAAIHLMVENGVAALVDTGTRYSVPGVMAALAHKRIAPEQVAYIFLTHIHLDHAGGAYPVLILDHTSLESSYLILARNHFFLTDSISKGNNGKLAIYNDTEHSVCVNLSSNKSILYAIVEPSSFLEYESEYYHEFADPNNS